MRPRKARRLLILAARKQRAKVDNAERVFAAPYSGYDALTQMHFERGVWIGLHKALETIEAI